MQRAVTMPRPWPFTAALTGVMALAAALATHGEGDARWAEVDVAAYPGATAIGSVSRVRTAEATTVIAAYETPDRIDRVMAFYRDALRATSASQQLFDDANGDGVSLMLSHGPQRRSVVVDIDRSGSGTSIQVRTKLPAPRAVHRCVARSAVCTLPTG